MKTETDHIIKGSLTFAKREVRGRGAIKELREEGVVYI